MRIVATDCAPIQGLTFTDDGAVAVVHSGAPNPRLRAVAVSTGAIVWERPTPFPIAVAPNGRRVASWDDGQSGVTVWDVPKWVPIAQFNHDWAQEHRFVFSPNGNEVAGISCSGEVWRWQVPPGYPFEPLEARADTIDVRYSPGGRWLAALVRPTKLRFWERSSLRLFTDVEFSKVRARDLRFELSSDDDTVAVLLEKPLLLSITREREPLSVTGSRGYVFSTAFSPNGKTFLAGTNDGVRAFDVRTGVERRWYDFDCGAALALAFSPDGLTCAAGGENGQVVVWDVDD